MIYTKDAMKAARELANLLGFEAAPNSRYS
jgi:hypothetical protein